MELIDRLQTKRHHDQSMLLINVNLQFFDIFSLTQQIMYVHNLQIDAARRHALVSLPPFNLISH